MHPPSDNSGQKSQWAPGVLVIFVPLLLLLCVSFFAWHEHQELIANYEAKYRMGGAFDAQQELGEARRQIVRLESEILALRSKLARAGGTPAETTSGPQPAASADSRPMPGDVDPAARQRILGSIDHRYAALWKHLGLSPSQIQQFEAILLNRALIGQDVTQALQDQGIDRTTDPEAYRQALRAARSALDVEITNDFGASVFTDYQQYQQGLPQRTLIDNSFQPFLGNVAAPLSSDQEEQLIQILGQNPGNNGIVSNLAVSAAAAILTPDQLKALQDFQSLQQKQQALSDQLNQIQQQLSAPMPTGPRK